MYASLVETAGASYLGIFEQPAAEVIKRGWREERFEVRRDMAIELQILEDHLLSPK
jgi:hypothetical protein